MSESTPRSILGVLKKQKLLHPRFVEDVKTALDYAHRRRSELHIAYVSAVKLPEKADFEALIRLQKGTSISDRRFYYTDSDEFEFKKIQQIVIEPIQEAVDLWIKQVTLPAEFDPLSLIIKKRLNEIKVSDKEEVQRVIEDLVKVLAYQKNFDLHWHEEVWWRLSESSRLLYWEAIKKHFPVEQQRLSHRLSLLTDNSGRSLHILLRRQDWQKRLNQLWASDQKGVRGSTTPVKFIENGVLVTRALHPAINEQLFDKDGKFKPKDEKISGHHQLYPIEIKGKRSFWFKLYPEQPGTEEAIGDLDAMLGVYGTPLGQLLKIYAMNHKKVIRPFPVYVSDSMAGVKPWRWFLKNILISSLDWIPFHFCSLYYEYYSLTRRMIKEMIIF